MTIAIYYDEKICGSLFYMIEIGHYLMDNDSTLYNNQLSILLNKDKTNLQNQILYRYNQQVNQFVDDLDFSNSQIIITKNISSLLFHYEDQFSNLKNKLIILYPEHAGMDEDICRVLKSKQKKIFFNVMKNVVILKNDLVTKSILLKTFFKFNTVEFRHGIYDKYWNTKNNNGCFICKDNDYSNPMNMFLYNSDLKGENRYLERDLLNSCLEYLNSNFKNIHVHSGYHVYPSSHYDGLVYVKYKDFCPRLPNEFSYYGKPIFLYNLNRGISYYLDNPIEKSFIRQPYRKMYIDVDSLKEKMFNLMKVSE